MVALGIDGDILTTYKLINENDRLLALSDIEAQSQEYWLWIA